VTQEPQQLSGSGRVVVEPFLRGGFISSAFCFFLFAYIGFRPLAKPDVSK
jgi:hypothetical protein